MAESLIVKTKRDGTITFSDLAGANSYTVSFEAGDLNLTIPGATVNNFLDRGRFPPGNPSIRYGDDQPLTGTFTAYLRDLSDATDVTLPEILAQTGQVGTTWTSTMGANGEVFTLKILWEIAGLIHGDTANHTCELDHCFITGSMSEGDPDQVSISFTSYQLYPTLT